MTARFLLTSVERREPYEPRTCRIVRRLKNEVRDDLALVEISPPLPANVFDTRRDLDHLILASKREGHTLFPVSEWPHYVYVCGRMDGEIPQGDTISSDGLMILDWGVIVPTKKNAK